MSEINYLQLKTSSVLNVPMMTYGDFTFVVNGKEFKTSRLIADILSPKISKIHLSDPTIDTYTINTQHQGKFKLILCLATFKKINYTLDDILFIEEVIENLEIEEIDIENTKQNDKITIDNVFSQIKVYENSNKIYYKRLSEEIEFISSNFYSFIENKVEELCELKLETLISIIDHPKLQIESEDQLLSFVNKLYGLNVKYSILYDFVYFSQVSSENMKEFILIFDKNLMTAETWMNICERLEQDVTHLKEGLKTHNVKKVTKDNGKVFQFNQNNPFDGIIKSLISQSKDQINITSSEFHYTPKNVICFNNPKVYFHSQNKANSWICFDFKEHKIIPNAYSIRTSQPIISAHPRSWVIEASNDKNSWEVIDTENNCSFLNGRYLTHTFEIKNPPSKEFRYFKMRSTGPDWQNDNYLIIDSFELFGKLF